jgi:hypothetical protein
MLLQKNMTFYGISRSGNHAIIFWVINNLGGFTEMIRNKIYWNPDTIIFL